MVDIEKKIEKIEKNCLEIAKKELEELKIENTRASKDKISEMVENYKRELAKKYEAEMDKLKREHNRNIFDYEMSSKKRVSNLEYSLRKNVENRVINAFKDFSNCEEYKGYLINSIRKVLEKVQNSNCTIFITENDYYRYGEEFSNIFNIRIDKFGNENIGGCLLINEEEKISIDNTLKTNILEKTKNISF